MPQTIVGTETFTNGAYERPVSGDQGNEDIFAILEAFMDRMAPHTHDGSDSSEINLNVSKEIQILTIGTNLTWLDELNGNYKAVLPVPPPATFDDNQKFFYISRDSGATYERFYPSLNRLTATTYEVFSNDNTVDLKVVTL